jgi:hypothetical protein
MHKSLGISCLSSRGVNYSEKSVRRFLGLENPGNFSRDSGIFSPNLRDFGIFFEIFSLWDFGILGFSKILGFFQRFFGTFDEVYEDFQSNLPLVSSHSLSKGRWL